MMRLLGRVYRVRSILVTSGIVGFVVLGLAGRLFDEGSAHWVKLVILGIAITALLCLILGILTTVFGARFLPTQDAVVTQSPVRGRWLGMNSPATRVPSHGVRAYGQAYAIDLTHEPLDAGRPVFGDGPAMRAPGDYPAFGQPVYAMIDGTVVKASGWRRDHRARSRLISVLYMFIEGSLRELGGPGFIVGNHVNIRGSGGVFAAVGHLQQGSVALRVGDIVRAGDLIGRCGNSGNSSEPHVHAQLMDRASLWTAQGIPMAFAGITLEDGDAPTDGLPRNEQHMTAVGPRSLNPETAR